jgi:F-type H+-transporting ATPase subunit delta
MINPVAYRYASALFGIAVEEKSENTLLSQFSELIAMMSTHNNLQQAIDAPLVKIKEQENALGLIAKKAKWHQHFASMLKLMAQRRRLAILPDVYDAFVERVRNKNNEIHALVTSAKPLSDSDKKKIEQIIAKPKKTSKVVLEEHLNDSLLGGFIIEVGSTRIDASLAGRIRRLEQNLRKTNL